MAVETLVVVALSITILMAKAGQPGGINFDAFDPHHARGFSGFWAAMIFGVLDFCGFDVVSTAAEEAKAPREYLPKTILLTVIGIAVFWALNAWAFTLSTPDEQVHNYTAHGLTAVTPMAQAYWHAGSVIIIVTAFTGLTAVYISSMQGVSRIVFALARHGLLPSALARLSGEKRVPRNAVLTLLAAVITLDLTSLYLLGNALDSFTWWANALVFFATLTFLSVNVANLLHFRCFGRSLSGIVQHRAIPVLGVLMNAYLLYAAFFSSLWGGNWRTGKSVVVASVALLALQICAVLHIRFFKRALLTQEAPIGVEWCASTEARSADETYPWTREKKHEPTESG
jgi:amino acid transporter